MESRDTEIKRIQVLFNQNNKILDIIQSRCERIVEELQEEFKCDISLFNEDDTFYLCSIVDFIYKISIEESVFSELWQPNNNIAKLFDRDFEIYKMTIKEFIERTDEILEWLGDVEDIIFKKQYQLYLSENEYYD